MALIILIENLVNAMDNGKCAVGIFLDFQKAFDTVDHCILLDKLYLMVSAVWRLIGFPVTCTIANN